MPEKSESRIADASSLHVLSSHELKSPSSNQESFDTPTHQNRMTKNHPLVTFTTAVFLITILIGKEIENYTQL
jgi:hypothetical protein